MFSIDARQGLALALSAVAVTLLWFAFTGDDAPAGLAGQTRPPAYPVRDWSEPAQRELNISLYTYNDRNRNGRYDTGDLPMASVAVRLNRPGAYSLTHRSNINGFANFEMSWQREQADISLADQDYGLEVQVPPGWAITSGNATQVLRFRHVPGSVTGLATDLPPAAVGLAPVLTVAGRVSVPGDGEPVANGINLQAIDPAGRRSAVELSGSGVFAFVAEPGKWSLLAENMPTGEVLRRSFVVSDAPVRVAALQFGLASAEPLALPVTQDFDYLVRSDIGKIPGGTYGLDWDYLLAVDNQVYNGPGFVNALRSGKNVGYNSSGHPVTIAPAPGRHYFDFVGAFFATAWPEAEGETLVIQAWRAGKSVAREEVALSYLGPVWFDADFRRIDKLTLATEHYWQFITEDMVFRLEEPVGKPAALE